MPDNAQYQRLLKLVKSPNGQAILAMIRRGEGTAGELGYNTHVGGSTYNDLSKKNRTLVKDLNSTASGAYQFVNKTWDNISSKLGITDFSKESQDVAAMKLLTDTPGALEALQKGDLKTAMFKAGKHWAGVPINEKGDSMAKKLGQSAVDPITLLNVGFKKMNLERANSKDPEVKKNNSKIQNEFYKEIKDVDKQNISNEAKNVLRQNIYQKYYRSGDMAHINQNIQNRATVANENKKLADSFNRYKNNQMNAAEMRLFEKELNNRKIKTEPGQDDRNGRNFLTKSLDFEGNEIQPRKFDVDKLGKEIENIVQNSPTTYGLKPIPGLMTYGMRADDPLFNDVPKDDGINYDLNIIGSGDNLLAYGSNSNQNTSSGSFANNNPVSSPEQVPFNSDTFLSQFNPDTEMPNESFVYTPGNQQFPLEALGQLATGLIGMDAGNIDIKYRDEQVSNGLLAYAAELEQIKNIGLSPEVEGDLQMKLASAYQTGLTNIVRASNGNRNLVLGNQGQVDQARMKGIVDIALADVDRRDKAMAAYGEVQKYISEFNANRDIANNERQYREDEKIQMSGASLAKQGFEGLMNTLQAQRENAPNSANDMMKQFLMFHISGVNSNAKPGEPGSVEYAEKIKTEKSLQKTGMEKMMNFAKDLDPENQKQLSEFLTNNPDSNVSINSNADVDKVINMFSEATGQKSNYESFQEDQGVNPAETVLTQTAIDQTVSGNGPNKIDEPSMYKEEKPKTSTVPLNPMNPAGTDLSGTNLNSLKLQNTSPPIITTNQPSNDVMKKYMDNDQEFLSRNQEALKSMQEAKQRMINLNSQF